MNFIKKIDSKVALKVAGIVLSVAGAVVASATQANEQKAMKDSLKEEILKDLSKQD